MPRVITIASGKGGVGKTSISLNLSLALARKDRKVCLVDADLGMSNVDVLLGLTPEYTLEDYLEGRCPLERLLMRGPGTLRILPAGTALGRPSEGNGNETEPLSRVLGSLETFQEIVIDGAAGLSERILHLMESAGLPVLVIVPEPTSLTDAYSVLKAFHHRGNRRPVYILANRVRSSGHAKKVFGKFQEAVQRFIPVRLEMLGHVLSDPRVGLAVREQTPLVEQFPESEASKCLVRIASEIASNHRGHHDPEGFYRLLNPAAGRDDRDRDAGEPRPETEEEGEEALDDILGLLVKDGHVDRVQVAYARKVQERLDTPKKLLTILKELNYINEEKIRETLYNNRTSIRLGALLVELGYITEKQLQTTLKQQKQAGRKKRLGQLLVESNYISEYDLTQALSLNLGIPYVEPVLKKMDVSLLEKASVQFFLEHRFLPLYREEKSVAVAFADPLDRSCLDAAKRMYGSSIITLLTLEKSIRQSVSSYVASKSRDTRAQPQEAEVVALVDALIRDALMKGISDIHIEPLQHRIRVRFRKDGSLVRYGEYPKDLGPALVNRIKIMASANIAEKRRHQDGRILLGGENSGEETDIRVSFYVTLFGEKVVMRILNKKEELFKVSDLGMGPKMLERFREDVLELPSGVVIITGPTGSGKTTTLYAAINYCNNVDTNIITAEEPVEYVIEGIAQCSINPKIGVSFEETLRHIMRQDPDVIILGEIRDRFSAESAIQAALTGHKVLTTFHTEDSIGGLLRLMNMDIEAFLISSTVVSVVAQRLLKKVCTHCRTPYVPTAKDLRRLKYQAHQMQSYPFQIGSGCEHCDFTGYKGRVGVFELLVLNEYVKDAILHRKTSYEIRRISIETTGLITLVEDGIAKAAKGITSLPEVLKHLPLLETPRPIDQIRRLLGEAE